MKAKLASLLLRLLAHTWRISIVGALPDKPCMVAFWHGEMLPCWFSMRKASPTAVVSASTDGALLARFLTDLGFHVVRGSSSRGGADALQAMVDSAQDSIVMVTPDGPRGPARECKPGVVVGAHRASVPIVLFRAVSARKKIFTRSWDNFELPLPFTRITLTVSAPIVVPSDAERKTIDALILDIGKQLDLLG